MIPEEQLKQALAKMLPDTIDIRNGAVCWTKHDDILNSHVVRDTELLHICWLVENNLNEDEWMLYFDYLEQQTTMDKYITNSPWQHRTIALAKVKGIEII